MRTFKPLILGLVLGFLALPVAPHAAAQVAADGEAVTTTRAMVEAELAELKTELALGDYTWTQVEQILKSGIRERVAIARRYGAEGGMELIQPLDGSEKRAMKRELKDSRKDTEKRMKRYLDKEQMKAFEAVQDEQYDALLEWLENA